MKKNRSWAGRAALITGASRGLGAALAGALAERGAKVVLVARGSESLEHVAAQIRGRGGEAHAIALDVAAPEAATRIASAAAALVGDLDLVVHNASTLGPVPLRPLAETSDADFARAIEVNLGAAFRLSRAVVGGMVARGAGTLVHVSSDAADSAYPSWGAYGVSKAGLDFLARVWAAELEGTGVTALSVDPGEMDTQMHAAALPDADPATLLAASEVARRLLALLESTPGPGRFELARFATGAAA